LILPDLPLLEYEENFKHLFEANDLGISFLISPQTTSERIEKVDCLTRGFIYMVSNAAITGAKKGISSHQIEYFERVKKMSLQNPKMIGFGISDHETYSTACQYANGAIIGSAFIKALTNGNNLKANIKSFVQSIRNS